jgi:hypothetical protein
MKSNLDYILRSSSYITENTLRLRYKIQFKLCREYSLLLYRDPLQNTILSAGRLQNFLSVKCNSTLRNHWGVKAFIQGCKDKLGRLLR